MPPSQEVHLYEQKRLAMQTSPEHAAVSSFMPLLAQAGQDWYCGLCVYSHGSSGLRRSIGGASLGLDRQHDMATNVMWQQQVATDKPETGQGGH